MLYFTYHCIILRKDKGVKGEREGKEGRLEDRRTEKHILIVNKLDDKPGNILFFLSNLKRKLDFIILVSTRLPASASFLSLPVPKTVLYQGKSGQSTGMLTAAPHSPSPSPHTVTLGTAASAIHSELIWVCQCKEPKCHLTA